MLEDNGSFTLNEATRNRAGIVAPNASAAAAPHAKESKAACDRAWPPRPASCPQAALSRRAKTRILPSAGRAIRSAALRRCSLLPIVP